MVFNHVLETIKDKILPQIPGVTASWKKHRDRECAKQRVHHIAGGNPAEQGLANHS